MSTMLRRTTAPLAELDEEALQDFRRRAAEADRANTYFHEDLEVLRAIGYLRAALPEAHGGSGADLAAMAAATRRLARYAPATALGMCMHQYWVGTAVEMERLGEPGCGWILDAVADGAVFASGHAERGNDAPVVMSTTMAEPAEGGYRITGRKMFGSNGPVWDFLGFHALDASDPTRPTIVHGFAERGTPGITVLETWDTLGMRPTQSHDTLFEGAFVPHDRIGRLVPAGSDADVFLLAMNVWALGLIMHVYLGIADRAIELAVADAHRKTSVAIPRGTHAHNPMVHHQVAEMVLALDAASALAERLVGDWTAGVDHGPEWGVRVFSAKWHVANATKRVVDLALEVTGGSGMFRSNELERLYRDVRCGGFHPASDALTHESIGKATLGIDPTGPRW